MMENQQFAPLTVPQSATPSVDSAEASRGVSFQKPKPFALNCAAAIVEAKIPKRDWIMHGRYAGKFITLTYSPGGVGKSMLTMLEAIAVATGRNLTGFEVPNKRPVWIYNLEDPKEELECRLAAIAKHHGIAIEELKGVYYNSGHERRLTLAKNGKNGVELNDEAIQDTIQKIKERDIGLFIIDPLVRCNDADENNNKQMDKVMLGLQRIAIRTGCAIGIAHHTAKKGSNSRLSGLDDAERFRGASAVFDAARVAHLLEEADPKDLHAYGLENGVKYIKLFNTKGNLFKKNVEAKWYRLAEVVLDNGDEVGVPELMSLENKAERAARLEADKIRDAAARVFFREMSKEEVSIQEAIDFLRKDKGAWSFFERYTNDRSIEKRLKELFATPCLLNGKSFALEEYADRRPKFYLKCEGLRNVACDA